MSRQGMKYQPRKCAREPIARKKERKEDLQIELYYRRRKKWKAREPARWRLIAHLRWRWERPRAPWENSEEC